MRGRSGRDRRRASSWGLRLGAEAGGACLDRFGRKSIASWVEYLELENNISDGEKNKDIIYRR